MALLIFSPSLLPNKKNPMDMTNPKLNSLLLIYMVCVLIYTTFSTRKGLISCSNPNNERIIVYQIAVDNESVAMLDNKKNAFESLK